MKKLDNPERRKLLPPHKLLELLEIQDNDILIDWAQVPGTLPYPGQLYREQKLRLGRGTANVAIFGETCGGEKLTMSS